MPSFSGVGNVLEELAEMALLILEELYLLISFLDFNFPALSISLFNCLDLRLELNDFVLEFCLFGFELFNLLLKVCLSMLCLELLSHRKGNGALIKSLISCDSHLNFISNSEKKETSLGLVQSDLTDDFVEALGEEFFSDWTDAALSGLALHEFLIEHFSESGNIDSSGLLMTHILNVMFA